jgi:hypothetical protein
MKIKIMLVFFLFIFASCLSKEEQMQQDKEFEQRVTEIKVLTVDGDTAIIGGNDFVTIRLIKTIK